MIGEVPFVFLPWTPQILGYGKEAGRKEEKRGRGKWRDLNVLILESLSY